MKRLARGLLIAIALVVTVHVARKLIRVQPHCRTIQEATLVEVFRVTHHPEEGEQLDDWALSGEADCPIVPSSRTTLGRSEARELASMIRVAHLLSDSALMFGFTPKVLVRCTQGDRATELVFGVGGNGFKVHQGGERPAGVRAGDGLMRKIEALIARVK